MNSRMLKLKNLSVKSFVTQVDRNKLNTYKGGLTEAVCFTFTCNCVKTLEESCNCEETTTGTVAGAAFTPGQPIG